MGVGVDSSEGSLSLHQQYLLLGMKSWEQKLISRHTSTKPREWVGKACTYF